MPEVDSQEYNPKHYDKYYSPSNSYFVGRGEIIETTQYERREIIVEKVVRLCVDNKDDHVDDNENEFDFCN